MHVSFEAFWLPKAGNSAEEYEDAFWPAEPFRGLEDTAFCCALADGATEASFSALWAGLLVQAYCRHPDPDELVTVVPELQSRWGDAVDSRPLPWYAEQKARSGAFAALVGLQVVETPDAGEPSLTWQALAVGDACLVQMRGYELIATFPVCSSKEFGSRPYLIGSRSQRQEDLNSLLSTTSGGCQPGDTLYLMTDAIACWFLAERERNGRCYNLGYITTVRKFERLVRRERLARDADGCPSMKNDDTTLIRVEVSR